MDEQREMRGMRLRKPVVLIIGALALVGVLVTYLLASDQQGGEEVGSKGNGESSREELNITPPKDKTLRLTVPKMERMKYDEIPTGPGKREGLFRAYTGVHIKHKGWKGWPWQKEANVYIAGHRIGYKNSKSYLAFFDLNKLEKGDDIYITDSEGRKYTYVVFEMSVGKGSWCGVLNSNNLSELKPVEGKNIVTLQTCTLPPAHANRLLVRGELKDVSEV